MSVLQPLDWVVIAGYFGLILVVGFEKAKENIRFVFPRREGNGMVHRRRFDLCIEHRVGTFGERSFFYTPEGMDSQNVPITDL